VRIKKSVPIFLICLASLAPALSQDNSKRAPSPLDGWSQTNPPPDEEEQGCATYSRDEWKVELRSDSAGVVKYENKDDSVLPAGFRREKGMVGRLRSMRMGNWWLLGFDDGEFGGGLWRYDGTKSEHLLNENVRGIALMPGGALVFTGLNHLGSDYGKLYWMPLALGGRLQLKASLGGAPSAIFQENYGSVLAVTTQGILRVSQDGTYERVYKKNMGMLYPNSIVKDSKGTIFVGMRFYVLTVNALNRPAAQWLIRNECKRTRLKDYECVCTGKRSM
jgi:hypothetical protein